MAPNDHPSGTSLHKRKLQKLNARVKLLIENSSTQERLAFGPGVAALCLGVRNHGSISAAAKEMNMSYSKAWKIIGQTEEALGIKLVIRKKPQGCWLTVDGDALLNEYLSIAGKISKSAESQYAKRFA